MESAKRQYFGIKYPFTSDGFQNFYLDANENRKEKVRSELMHVIFTPKGQRLRMPGFGTNLIKFIFEQNDSVTWETVKAEVSDAVKRWINNIIVNDIQVVRNTENEAEIYVRVDYSVIEGNNTTTDSVVVQV